MTTSNVNGVDYLKPWVIFFLLSFVGTTVAGAIIGGVAGGVLAVIGGAPRLISIVAGGLGFLISLPISYFCFRFAVSKFLLPKISSTESTVEPLKAAA
jgi:hypothetical protein